MAVGLRVIAGGIIQDWQVVTALVLVDPGTAQGAHQFLVDRSQFMGGTQAVERLDQQRGRVISRWRWFRRGRSGRCPWFGLQRCSSRATTAWHGAPTALARVVASDASDARDVARICHLMRSIGRNYAKVSDWNSIVRHLIISIPFDPLDRFMLVFLTQFILAGLVVSWQGAKEHPRLSI
jgi:hypothetical protein